MNSYQEIPEDIKKQIKDYENKINGLKKMKGSQRDPSVGKLEKQTKRIKRLMETYQYTIESQSFESQTKRHKEQLKDFQYEINRLNREFQKEKENPGVQIELFKNRKKEEETNWNDRQQVIQKGHKLQEEGTNVLNDVLKDVLGMEQKGALATAEMDRQIKKMDQIYDELNDTETTLGRAQKHLKYFAKSIYTDRILVCLMITIGLAILVIIILKIAGKTPSDQNGTVQ